MYVPISNKFEVDNVHLIGNSTYRMILENFSAKRRAWGGERVFFLSMAWFSDDTYYTKNINYF